jgi:N-acetylglucosamine-6-phosphate deacetylase
MGTAPGVYSLGGRSVTVTNREARLADGTLAGSMIPLDQCLRNLISYAGISLLKALPTVTSTPADLMGISNERGQLKPGMAADMVLLTRDLQVHTTIVNGHVVYQEF